MDKVKLGIKLFIGKNRYPIKNLIYKKAPLLNYTVIKHPHCYELVDKVKMPTKFIQPRQIVIDWPVISCIYMYFLLILVAKNELLNFRKKHRSLLNSITWFLCMITAYIRHINYYYLLMINICQLCRKWSKVFKSIKPPLIPRQFLLRQKHRALAPSHG